MLEEKNAAEITDMIHVCMRKRYTAPEWALLFGVGNATGRLNQGWCDAIAMNLYPSRGLALHGFEFKSHRGDWKKELANPEKAENIARYCDYWWLVAEAGVMNDGELPKGWGYLEHWNGKLQVAAPAALLTPKAIDRHFLAALLRRSQGPIEGVIDKMVQERVAGIRERREARIQQDVEARTTQFTKLENNLKEIKKRCGLDLLGWTPTDEIAAAVKLSLSADVFGSHKGIGRLVKDAENFATRIRKAAQDLGVELPI